MFMLKNAQYKIHIGLGRPWRMSDERTFCTHLITIQLYDRSVSPDHICLVQMV